MIKPQSIASVAFSFLLLTSTLVFGQTTTVAVAANLKEAFISSFLQFDRVRYVQAVLPFFWFNNLKLIQRKAKIGIHKKNISSAENSIVSKQINHNKNQVN